MMKLVTRDAEGRVINIGEWDLCLRDELLIATGEEVLSRTFDQRNKVIVEQRARAGEVLGTTGNQVVTNPMPEGATQAEEEVIEGYDGGLYVVGDPRAAGKPK